MMEIEDKIHELKDAQSNFDLRPRALGVIALALVLAIGAWTAVFQVGADSVGMVLRLGEYVRQTEPGLHFKLPFGIEKVRKVPTEKQLKEEFGFRTARADVESDYSNQGYPKESLMLTGDLNVVDLQWSVQHRIVDPEKYLFRVRNVEDTFRYMTQAVMREIVGDRTVNEVLTIGRSEVAASVQAKLQELCNQYETGVRVDQVILQDITPPDPVKPSFNEVNQAQQQKEEQINQAKADYNKEIPSARGEAKRTIEQAEGYAVNRVNRAKGDASRFESLYEEYEKAPDVTRQRIYLENLGEVLPQVERKVVIDENASDVLPLLPLGDGGFSDITSRGTDE